MTSLEKLSTLFERFPGIGPRQARRFVYHLLTQEPRYLAELADLIASIQNRVTECTKCFRFFAKNGAGETTCEICANSERDHALLMVVERDSDIPPIEKSDTYNGYYFVLGGTIPLLDSEDAKKLRGGALKKIIEARAAEGLKEVILACSVNPDGENTSRYVAGLLEDLAKTHGLTVSTLGRGLSTGSELEYADPETIKSALQNRSKGSL